MAIKNYQDKNILGHPVGLFILFFTEMWERFSYYGMRALLMLYMTKYLILDPEKARSVLGYSTLEAFIISAFGATEVQDFASQIYGLYTGFVYLSPLFGGIIADKILGQRKSVYLGGALMAIGHFLMAFESFFLLALFFLILGNGSFKPNISTQVGNLYAPGDQRRDGAFTIFYMGINLGAFFSPLICGTLGELYGWHYGFAAAGFGMLIGLTVYHYGRSHLPEDLFSASAKGKESTDYVGLFKILGTFLLSMAAFCVLLAAPTIIKTVLGVALIAGLIFWLSKLPKVERSPVMALMALCLGTISFWTIFEQQGNTLQLWATDRTEWTIAKMNIGTGIYNFFGSLNSMVSFTSLNFFVLAAIALILYSTFRAIRWAKTELNLPNGQVDKAHDKNFKCTITIFLGALTLILLSLSSFFAPNLAGDAMTWSLTLPSTWYQSFNPFFVFTFAPILNMIWARSIARGKTPSSSVRKMGIGCFMCGAAFLFMVIASKVLGTDTAVKASIMWLVITTWIFTMGELYLSPIGLSLVTKVAPARMLSTMMGMWFLSSFFGNFLSGYVGAIYDGAATADNSGFFIILAILGCVTGVLFIIAEKPLTKIVGKA